MTPGGGGWWCKISTPSVRRFFCTYVFFPVGNSFITLFRPPAFLSLRFVRHYPCSTLENKITFTTPNGTTIQAHLHTHTHTHKQGPRHTLNSVWFAVFPKCYFWLHRLRPRGAIYNSCWLRFPPADDQAMLSVAKGWHESSVQGGGCVFWSWASGSQGEVFDYVAVSSAEVSVKFVLPVFEAGPLAR